jgi:hypothetical protein
MLTATSSFTWPLSWHVHATRDTMPAGNPSRGLVCEASEPCLVIDVGFASNQPRSSLNEASHHARVHDLGQTGGKPGKLRARHEKALLPIS